MLFMIADHGDVLCCSSKKRETSGNEAGETTSHNDKTTSHNGETTSHNDKTTPPNGTSLAVTVRKWNCSEIGWFMVRTQLVKW